MGIDPEDPIRVKRFPRRRSPLELLFTNRGSAENVALVALSRALSELQPNVRQLKRLGLRENQGVLSMPQVP